MAGADDSRGVIFTKMLDTKFIQLMDEIGIYGYEKHKEKSFQYLLQNNLPLDTGRLLTSILHARDHIADYKLLKLHDHFNTLEHQLAAAAYNLMMEYVRVREEGKNDQRRKEDI